MCSPAYSGPLCESPICLNHCLNNGRCDDGLGTYFSSNNSFSNPTSSPKCKCNERYTGDRCQFDKCIKEASQCPPNSTLNSACKCLRGADCDSFYCNNKNGTCFSDNGQLACKCRVGFSGPTCLVNECSGYCFNGGECLLTDSSYYCK
jgi:integrin beta 2